MAYKMKDLTNERFNKLTVIGFSHKIKHGKKYSYFWNCKCDCGKIKTISVSNLNYNRTKSCGCIRSDAHIKHGFTKGSFKSKRLPRFYRIWKGIKQRCLDKNFSAFNRYGKKGITISKNWLKFESFKHDMYDSYLEHCQKYGEKETSIDRIDNNLGYSKENCRWATFQEQSHNTKTYINNKEKRERIKRLEKITGKTYEAIYAQINKGKSDDEILHKKLNLRYSEYIEFFKDNLINLPKRNLEIMAFRYGLNGLKKHTLQETGDNFCITRQRIQQIEKKSLEMLANT